MPLDIPDYSGTPSVLKELFSTITKLVVRDEFCAAVMEMGGLHFILKALQSNVKEKVSNTKCPPKMKGFHAISLYRRRQIKTWRCGEINSFAGSDYSIEAINIV